jgi:hypothetical protein
LPFCEFSTHFSQQSATFICCFETAYEPLDGHLTFYFIAFGAKFLAPFYARPSSTAIIFLFNILQQYDEIHYMRKQLSAMHDIQGGNTNLILQNEEGGDGRGDAANGTSPE